MEGYKAHQIYISDELNEKAHKIKRHLKLKNLSDLFEYLIKEFKDVIQT